MMKSSIFAVAGVALATGSMPANAASSDWHHVEGASIRLVTSSKPASDGRVRGALQIMLKPGWKTYWRDPGASGVPPTLTATSDGTPIAVNLEFPEPRRFDDEYAPWVGYDRSVAIAVTMELPDGADTGFSLVAEAFLGVCETICIPVPARLQVESAQASQSGNEDVIVEQAFAALPAAADASLHAKAASFSDGELTIDAVVPDGAEAVDIFVAGTDRLTLDTPRRAPDGTRISFILPVHGETKAGEELAYTLTTRSGAVSGHLRIP